MGKRKSKTQSKPIYIPPPTDSSIQFVVNEYNPKTKVTDEFDDHLDFLLNQDDNALVSVTKPETVTKPYILTNNVNEKSKTDSDQSKQVNKKVNKRVKKAILDFDIDFDSSFEEFDENLGIDDEFEEIDEQISSLNDEEYEIFEDSYSSESDEEFYQQIMQQSNNSLNELSDDQINQRVNQLSKQIQNQLNISGKDKYSYDSEEPRGLMSDEDDFIKFGESNDSDSDFNSFDGFKQEQKYDLGQDKEQEEGLSRNQRRRRNRKLAQINEASIASSTSIQHAENERYLTREEFDELDKKTLTKSQKRRIQRKVEKQKEMEENLFKPNKGNYTHQLELKHKQIEDKASLLDKSQKSTSNKGRKKQHEVQYNQQAFNQTKKNEDFQIGNQKLDRKLKEKSTEAHKKTARTKQREREKKAGKEALRKEENSKIRRAKPEALNYLADEKAEVHGKKTKARDGNLNKPRKKDQIELLNDERKIEERKKLRVKEKQNTDASGVDALQRKPKTGKHLDQLEKSIEKRLQKLSEKDFL
ncbi:hypothetical protein WICMUC_002237 [Wickerhamomyces mucosus]|uniref:Uncharacterized protein n=1 Tax=Wickerhamomyces mucosus TaxID=1378264 RepID=A0A9P8PPQ0_9ASCO|nr:hypothetical protein WICMUC_002237 [Wickerhamomyces mucosus]